MQTIKMLAHGSTFSTRERAQTVANSIRLDRGETEVVIDFAGVRAVSYSFADELVRAVRSIMVRQHLATLHLVGTDPAVLNVFQQILERRQVAEHKEHGIGRHEDTTILIGAA